MVKVLKIWNNLDVLKKKIPMYVKAVHLCLTFFPAVLSMRNCYADRCDVLNNYMAVAYDFILYCFVYCILENKEFQ